MVENIMSSMARVIGYDGAMCCKKKLMTMLELGQPRVVVIMRGWKTFMDSDIGATFVDMSIAT